MENHAIAALPEMLQDSILKLFARVEHKAKQVLTTSNMKSAAFWLMSTCKVVVSGVTVPDTDATIQTLFYLGVVSGFDFGWRVLHRRLRLAETCDASVAADFGGITLQAPTPFKLAQSPSSFNRVHRATNTEITKFEESKAQVSVQVSTDDNSDEHDTHLNLYNAVSQYDYEFLLKLKRLASAQNFCEFQDEIEKYRTSPALILNESRDDLLTIPNPPPAPPLPGLFGNLQSKRNESTVGFFSFSPTTLTASKSSGSYTSSRKRERVKPPLKSTSSNQKNHVAFQQPDLKIVNSRNRPWLPATQDQCSTPTDAGGGDSVIRPSGRCATTRTHKVSNSREKEATPELRISPGTLVNTRMALKKVPAGLVAMTPTRSRRSQPLPPTPRLQYLKASRRRETRCELHQYMDRRRSHLADSEDDRTPNRDNRFMLDETDWE